MGKNLAGKTAFIIAILVVFIFGFVGIPHGSLKESMGKQIHLGLDLKGGIHLVLQVKVAEAVSAQTDNDVARLEADLQKAGVTGASVGKLDPAHLDTITISGISASKSSDLRGVLSGGGYVDYDVASNADGSSKLTMKGAAITALNKRTLETSIETITDRIDKLGVVQPTIQQYGLGENEILIELPGVDDLGRVQDIIQSTARLEIHQVTGGPFANDQDALQANGGVIPPDAVLMKGSATGGGNEQVWLLKRVSVVSGNDFRDAQPSTDENGRPDITFNLTTAAGDTFYKYTDENKGTGSMAIVLDNRVREVAGIQSAIRDSGRISGGGFTKQSAADLSLMLRTGALPASLEILETRVVGPSLGAASIRQGVIAAIAGMLAVMAFMLFYYRGAGINADLALIFKPRHPAGLHGLYGVRVDAAWHCGCDPDDRHGCGFERADLRAYPGGAARRQNGGSSGAAGFRACVDHDHRYARHHHRFGGDPVPVRHGSCARVCGDADVRSPGQPVHSSLCVAADLRYRPGEEGTRRGVVDLITG